MDKDRENVQTDEARNPRAGAESVASSSELAGLEQLLDRLQEIDGERDPVDFGTLLSKIGRRSFGAILLLAGVIVLLPLIGDVPGVPTLAALLVAITAGQLLAGRDYFWLPDFILQRSIRRKPFDRSLRIARKPARVVDRFTRPRLLALLSPLGNRVLAAAALGVAMVMPVLEFIPFSANLAGMALSAFGLAIVARDGLFAAISLFVTASIFVLVGYWLLDL